MENLLNVVNWLKNNYQDILAVYGGVVAVCSVIVRWTKTDVDNKILDKLISFMDCFSTCFKNSDKKIIEESKQK